MKHSVTELPFNQLLGIELHDESGVHSLSAHVEWFIAAQ